MLKDIACRLCCRFGRKHGVKVQLIKYIRDVVISFVEREIQPHVSQQLNPLQNVTDFVLKKSTRSLKAICMLCESGYGDDAQILGRTIFELSLNIAFICKPDNDAERNIITSDELARLYILHSMEEQKKMKEKIKVLNAKGQCVELINMIGQGNNDYGQSDNEWHDTYEEIIACYDRLRIKVADYLEDKNRAQTDKREWNLLNIKETSEVVGEPYECDNHTIYWSISKLVHPSPLGSFNYYGNIADQSDVIMQAIAFSFNCYWRILLNVDKVFNLGIGESINGLGSKFVALNKKG